MYPLTSRHRPAPLARSKRCSSIAAQYELSHNFPLTPFFVALGAQIAKTWAAGLPQIGLGGTDRPTFSLTPLDDQEFSRRYFTPLPLDRLVYLAKTMWPIATFREGVIEIEETAEEVVVAKGARVVEEVVVSKDVDERVEGVRDRVRRTEIDVDRAQGTERAGASQCDDADFRRHWTETGRPRGLSYEQSEGAYRFGLEFAGDAPGEGRDWSAVEPEARRRWEERNPGTWGRFMDSIRYAWERADRRRAA